MKIGYPCINWTLGCKSNSKFRLKSYSKERLIETVSNNLNCLSEILKYNVKHNILFFRITSDLIPFATHSICKFNWKSYFKKSFTGIGNFIKENKIRISMHPDQFVLINSLDEKIFHKSVNELIYHCDVLDAMGLDLSAKIQIHVGGVYNDKSESIKRFIKRYNQLDEKIINRLVIENDDKLYSFSDCYKIYTETGIPMLFDIFHHNCLNYNEDLSEIMKLFVSTWNKKDGLPMADYSSQKKDEKKGTHTHKIDTNDFKHFIEITKPYDFDIMLEIKDKEKSALKVVRVLINDERFILL